MNKKTLLAIIPTALLFLASCDISQMKHKPLIGSRQRIVAAEAGGARARTAKEAKSLEIPVAEEGNEGIILKRTGYTCSFNTEMNVPNWVAWKLTADHVDGPYKRNGIPFTADSDVPGSPNTFDYMRSGYDRGHMCPSADNRWSQEAQEQCFYLTNICPQEHSLNSGDWSELENKCREMARKHGAVYIVCGPIFYNRKHKIIGQEHKVSVPEAFFKVLLTMDGTPQACGFIYKNREGNRPMGDYVNSVDEVERITGLDFFSSLPDDIEEAVERKAVIPD